MSPANPILDPAYSDFLDLLRVSTQINERAFQRYVITHMHELRMAFLESGMAHEDCHWWLRERYAQAIGILA